MKNLFIGLVHESTCINWFLVFVSITDKSVSYLQIINVYTGAEAQLRFGLSKFGIIECIAELSYHDSLCIPIHKQVLRYSQSTFGSFTIVTVELFSAQEKTYTIQVLTWIYFNAT